MTSWITILVSAMLLSLGGLYLLSMRRKMALYQELFNASIQLNSTIRKKDLLQSIMVTMTRFIDAENSSIILVDPRRQDLYFEV